MVTLRKFAILLLVAVASFWASSSYAFFGLRDFPPAGVDTLFPNLDPEEVLLDISWQEIEPQNGQFDWTKIDSVVALISLHRRFQDLRDLVIQLDPTSNWAMPSPRQAPYDTDWETELSNAVPDHGYSGTLYNFSSALVSRIFQLIDESDPWPWYFYPSVTIVFGGDPNLTWTTTDSTFDHDVEGYIRCLRTVHRAVVEVQNQDRWPYPYYSMWGELDVACILEEHWLIQGDNHEALRDSLLTLAQLFHERDSLRLNSWEELQTWVASEKMQRSLAWAHRLANETANVDQINVLYTFKPAFLESVLNSYRNVIGRGNFEGWRSTYAAFEIHDGSQTQYSDRLLEVDYARRWVNGRSNGLESVYSPLLSDSMRQTSGLLGVEGHPNLALEVYKAASNRMYSLNPNSDSDAGRIGQVSWVKLADGAYDGGPQEFQIFLWLNSFQDSCTDTVSVTFPFGVYADGVVLSLYGETLEQFAAIDSLTILVSPVPVQIFGEWYLDVKDQQPVSPITFAINAAYPNPFNSSFTVEYSVSSPGDATVSLITLDGREVMKRELPSIEPGIHRESFALPELPSGEYFVRLSKAGVVESKRIVLLR